MHFNFFSGDSQESEGTHYRCIQWSQRHWHDVLVHNPKDLLLSPMEMLWPIVLHC